MAPVNDPAATLGAVTMLESGLAALAEVATRRPAELAAALLALVLVTWTVTWRVTRTVVTIAHEGGHALVAVLAGRGLTGIRLHADTSGLTVSTGRGRGPGLVATVVAGYPAPGLLAVGGATLVAAGRAGLMLWIAVGLLLATLVHVRNGFGLLAVLVTSGAVGGIAYAGGPALQAGFAATLCWFLIFGGLRAVRELQRGRRRGRTGDSDADLLAALTPVPGGAWAGLFWLAAAGSVAAAAWLLLLG